MQARRTRDLAAGPLGSPLRALAALEVRARVRATMASPTDRREKRAT